MNKKIFLARCVDTLYILVSIGIIVGLNTVFVPNITGIIIGFLVGMLAFSIIIYEMKIYKHESRNSFNKAETKTKVFIMSLFFLGFLGAGVYLVSYPIHTLTSKSEERVMLTVPAKPSTMRMFKCDTRIAVIDPNNLYDVSTYCANKKDYEFVVRAPVTEKYTDRRLLTVVYKVSPFGYKINSIKSL